MTRLFNPRLSGPTVTAPRPLTPMQDAFVQYLVRDGLSQTLAARKAGYRNAKDAGYTLLRTPHVQAAIRALQVRLIQCDIGNLAISALRAVLENRDQLLQTAAGCRVLIEAAKVGLDRAGLAEPAAPSAPESEDDALERFITSLPDDQLDILAEQCSRALKQADGEHLRLSHEIDEDQPKPQVRALLGSR